MLKLLYICTHNRCRSILSEAITHHLASDTFIARSAGSQPAGAVHPLSLKYLEENAIDTQGLCSQSWNDFEHFHPDIVITVCDSAAQEACPVWFGEALQCHWGLADPSKLEGDEALVAEAFRNTITEIRQRVLKMVQLNLNNLTTQQRTQAMINLGAEIRG